MQQHQNQLRNMMNAHQMQAGFFDDDDDDDIQQTIFNSFNRNNQQFGNNFPFRNGSPFGNGFPFNNNSMFGNGFPFWKKVNK